MKIIQISDIHLCKDPKARIFGLVNTEDTFMDVLELVKKEKPDLVLATGGLSQDGSVESYQRLSSYFETLDCLVYTIYGNHDNPDNFDKWLTGNNIKKNLVLETKFANFIFINSYKPNSDSGYVDHLNLQHLANSLKQYDNCIPVIHHHFIPLGTLIDNYILENSADLIEVLTNYNAKLKFCITGHVHNSYQASINGITVYSSLSTCIQFAKTKDLLFENKPPGITVYNFYGDTYEVIEKTI